MTGMSLREAGVFGEDEAKLLRDAYTLAVARLSETDGVDGNGVDGNVRRRLATDLIEAYRREKPKRDRDAHHVADAGLARYLVRNKPGSTVRFGMATTESVAR